MQVKGIIFLMTIVTVVGQIANYLTVADKDRYYDIGIKTLKNLSEQSSINDIHEVASAGRVISLLESSNKPLSSLIQSTCTSLNAIITNGGQHGVVGVTAWQNLQCKGSISSTFSTFLSSQLSISSLPSEILNVAEAYASLQHKLDTSKSSKLFNELSTLLDSSPSLYRSQVLVILYDIHSFLSDDLKGPLSTLIKKLISNVTRTASIGGGDKENVIMVDDGLLSTARILYSFIEFSNLYESISLPSKFIAGTSEFIVLGKYSNDIESIEYILHALKACSLASSSIPISISVSSSLSLPSKSSSGSLSVFVSTLWGHPIDKVSISISQGVKIGAKGGSKASLISNIPFIFQSNGIYEAALPPLEAGAYKLELIPSLSDVQYINIGSVHTVVHVYNDISTLIKSASVSLKDVTSDIKYKEKLNKKLELDSGSILTVSITLSQSVHQVFIRFFNKKENVEAIVCAKVKSVKTDNDHVIYNGIVNIGSLEGEFLHYKSGVYSVSVIIGDETLKDGISWELTDANILLSPEPPAIQYKLYHKSLMYDSDIALSPLPTIDHIFRSPVKRPPVIVSLIFACSIALPLLAFIIAIIYIGVNLKNFPTGGAFVYAVGFHISIAFTLGSLIYYWFQLTIFEVFQYLFLTGGGCGLFGYYLLRNLELNESHVKKA